MAPHDGLRVVGAESSQDAARENFPGSHVWAHSFDFLYELALQPVIGLDDAVQQAIAVSALSEEGAAHPTPMSLPPSSLMQDHTNRGDTKLLRGDLAPFSDPEAGK